MKARREFIVPYFVDMHKYLVPTETSKTALVSFAGGGDVDCHAGNCNTWNSFAIRERIMGDRQGAEDAALVD